MTSAVTAAAVKQRFVALVRAKAHRSASRSD